MVGIFYEKEKLGWQKMVPTSGKRDIPGFILIIN